MLLLFTTGNINLQQHYNNFNSTLQCFFYMQFNNFHYVNYLVTLPL